MWKSAVVSLGLAMLAFAVPAQAIDFQVGQVWSYETRQGEEASKVYIAKIDRDIGTRTIYHIYVDGLHLKNPMMEGGEQDSLTHVPVSRQALEASVTGEPDFRTTIPNIAEGYVIWREAFLQGQAGVFTMPVNQVVQHIEDAFNKPKQ